jgi:MFS family permease
VRRLWRGDYARIWTAQSINYLGDQIYLIALPWLVYDKTGSGAAMSLVYTAEMLPHVIFGLLGGMTADRGGRRFALVVGNISACLMTAGLAASGDIPSGVAAAGAILALALLLSSASSFAMTAAESIIPAVVDDSALVGQANSYIELSNSVGQVVGPACGGALIAALAASGALGLDAASFFIAAAIFAGLPPDTRSPRDSRPDSDPRRRRREHLSEIWAGAKFAPRNRVLRVAIVASALNNLILGAYDTLVILVLRRSHHYSASTVGLVLGMGGFAAVTSAGLVLPRLRGGRPGRRMLCSLLVLGLGTAGVALSPRLYLVVAFQMLYAGATTVFNVTWRTTRQLATPANLLGRVIGACRGIAYVGAAVGGLISATALSIGVRPKELFVIDGILVAFLAIVLSRSILFRADHHMLRSIRQEADATTLERV